jgi:hypothetical protein
MLGRWADVMLIAPLSCNTLLKWRMGNVIIYDLRFTYLLHARLLLRRQWMKICGIIHQQKKIFRN